MTHLSRLAGALLALGLVLAAHAAPVAFDIPAQPAVTALKLFGQQAHVEVIFRADELKEVQASAVKGDFEPAEAVSRLLAGTGFEARQTSGTNFIVVRSKTVSGSIRGGLTWPDGAPAEGVQVFIRETGQSAPTDRYGQYVFAEVPAGTFLLIAQAEGYQPLHLTDVTVKANSELILSKQAMRKADEITKLEPYVVHAESVTELDPYAVTGNKEKPFSTGNMDMPRSIDDVQPYYIFDSQTIETSGATNLEDLLKQRLTMNTVALTNRQDSTVTSGNTSSIDLRGLGTDKTLILINGRRAAGVSIDGSSNQTDLNGIPMSAIERIEVLPSSASGIYGGSAIGGVVNVILKRNYAGGELRATYDNTWNTDSPTRMLSASYGLTLEGGKTHVLLNGSWSDAQPLVLQDRRDIFTRNLTTIMQNAPSWIYSTTTPFLGALPNITPSSSTQTTLTLKNGVVLSSRNTYVAAGTSASTASADLYAALAANAGSWSLDLPASTQSPTGLLRPFGATPKTKSLMASIRRQMLPNLELFADFSYTQNNTHSLYNPYVSYFTVSASSPINPFTTAVRVRVPDATQVPVTTSSENRGLTAGMIAQLPWGWTGEFDYSWSESRFQYAHYTYDSAARTTDLLSGELNPFVDTLLHPLNLSKYLVPNTWKGYSELHDFALRGSGPLSSLAWGTPNLTLGLEYRVAKTPDNVYEMNYPLTPTNNYRFTYFGRKQETASGYGELIVPLVKADWLPAVHALDFQLSGRTERYTVDSGTPYYAEYPNHPSWNSYGAPTVDGERYFAKTSYTSTNGTVGLKYQPLPELTLRVSLASAFLPPSPDELVKNPQVDDGLTTVSDPKTGSSVSVQTISGGNPALKPQSSTSQNVGIIWTPSWKPLRGLRLNAEYYRIKQDNAIDTLSANQIVALESIYPGRVTRDSSGVITLVDISSLNLYKRETEGWDLSVDYTVKTDAGAFTLHAAESIILHLKNQYSLTLPEYDAVNFPSEGGAAKYKTNATLTWDWKNWTAGWTVRYFSSYKQYGAIGGPTSVRDYSGAAYTYYILAQGGDTIASQTYHDAFVSYAFGRKPRNQSDAGVKTVGDRLLDGLTLQLGVRNVFDKVPPFDAYYSSNYYISPYGDMRLRSYWLSVKKSF